MLEKACHEISSHSYSFAHTHIFLQSSSFSSSSFFFECELWNKVGTCVCVFSFLFSVLVHWGTDLSTEYIFLKDMLIPPPQSVLLCSPLPLWLINPLSIIWSQSITPFYRLSGGITISLFGAPLRMADPYQTEATPWTKEPLWSSLHSATDVSISIGCSCCMTVWTELRFLSVSLGRRRVLMNADDTVEAGGCACVRADVEGAGIPGHWPWLRGSWDRVQPPERSC